MSRAHVLGTSDSPIPDFLFPELSPFWLYANMTTYQVTTTIPLVGVSGFVMHQCIHSEISRSAKSRCVSTLFHELALLSIGLGPIRPSTYDLGQTAHRGFGDFDVTMYMPLGFPIPEFPMPPVLCTGCATCRLADVTRGLTCVRFCHVSL
jgi:hypothetical protein